PHCFAHRCHQLDGGLALLGVHVLPGCAERVKLQRLIAAADGLVRPLGIVARRPCPAVPSVRVSRDPLVTASAEQTIHRLPAGLADYAPHRDLNAADRRHYRGPALVLVPYHAADDGLDVERILTESPTLTPFVGQRLSRLLLPLQGRLADAGQPRVGV